MRKERMPLVTKCKEIYVILRLAIELDFFGLCDSCTVDVGVGFSIYKCLLAY